MAIGHRTSMKLASQCIRKIPQQQHFHVYCTDSKKNHHHHRLLFAFAKQCASAYERGRGVSIYIGWRMNTRVSVATKNMWFWCVVADDEIYTAFATMYVLPTSPFHTILLARLQLLKEFWVCLRFKFQKLQMTFKNWFGRIKRQSNIFFDKIAKNVKRGIVALNWSTWRPQSDYF